ncbi:MAG: type 1 glutamine amidotransferase [Janthinobacterium lividum]
MIRYLIAESETADQREQRRRATGFSSAESFAATLTVITPDARCDIVRPHEADCELPGPLSGYDGVFLSGSPLHVYDDKPETRRQLAFMRAVFASGTPSFGSCAGLQVAVAAAGGDVAKAPRHEVAVARRITAAEAGQRHPLLAGRPATWDALAIHSDFVTRLPAGATLLAGNRLCPIQAAEIRFEGGIFWGVQYHPELTLQEIAVAMRRQSDDIVEQGLARNEADVEVQAARLEALGDDPARDDLAWCLGIDTEITDPVLRHRELANFIEAHCRVRAAA